MKIHDKHNVTKISTRVHKKPAEIEKLKYQIIHDVVDLRSYDSGIRGLAASSLFKLIEDINLAKTAKEKKEKNSLIREIAREPLRKALKDGDNYVRLYAGLALKRLNGETVSAPQLMLF